MVLSGIVLTFLIVIISLIALLGVIYLCRAICFKARHASRRHLKFWVRPVLNGMRPGPSSEMIFRPLEEDTGPVAEGQDQGQVTNGSKGTDEPTVSVTVYKESERDSWDAAKVRISEHHDPGPVSVTVVPITESDGESAPPAIISHSNTDSKNGDVTPY